MMGGAFSWLFIVQAVLIGNLFLAANYYLWLGMGRVEGAQPLQKFIKYLLVGITLCFAVWATPRSIIATVSELRAMGGGTHPILGYFGVMSAKNTAVNMLILTTFMSFLLYRRTGKVAAVPWAKKGHAAQLTIFAVAAFIVIFLGVYGYFVEATVRIALSVPQVSSVLFAMVAITAIDVFLFRGAKKTGEVQVGKDARGLPVSADLHRGHLHLAHGAHGLHSFRLRQHWHVYGVVRDTSVDAFTPTIGFAATRVVSVTVLLFFLLVGFVFWITTCTTSPISSRRPKRPGPAGATAPVSSRRSSLWKLPTSVGGGMTMPHPVRVGALVLAATMFYTYVGQMVPQKEVLPPSRNGDRSQSDHRRHGQGGPGNHERQGTLLHLPHAR